MPLFIIINLALCFFAQTDSVFKSLLLIPLFMHINLGIAIVSLLGSLIKKFNSLVWFDLFSSATTVVWFAYWQTSFKDDSPMFFFYPLYFSMLSALISLFFINALTKVDKDSFAIMQQIDKKVLLHPAIIMVGILLSLESHQNFMLFPTLMTLLFIRFSIASSVRLRKH
jgi:hypothetical protein